MILTVIYAILIFCLLIFVHELGHFTTAKLVGIRVNEFSIGMGPQLCHFQRGETEYSLRAFPIGGYVKMEGEDEDSEDERAFNNRPAWARALVLIAGSFMNLLSAVLIITIMALVVGTATTTVGQVSRGMPAEAAGIQAGDRILTIDGAPVEEWTDVNRLVGEAQGETVQIAVERDGKELSLESGVAVSEDGRKVIGIMTEPRHAVWPAVQSGVLCIADWTKQMVSYLGQLFTGKGSMEDLVGPVGIVSLINDQAKNGFLYVANFMALISLNLAIINMLPLPALDGGRVLFLIIRCFTGKAISDETEAKIHFAGLILFFLLMIYLIVQDVGRFIIQ